jgi:uncharacterized protein YlxW (UPF0749 family)
MYVKIPDPLNIKEARFLFTPDPLTDRMYALLCANDPEGEKLRGNLQEFDLPKQTRSQQAGEDVLLPEQLQDSLANALSSGEATSRVLEEQLFELKKPYLHAVMEMLGKTPVQEQGFAVVLDDAIGITQTLNNWRNAALEDTLSAWLDKTHADNGVIVSNEHKIQVAKAFENVRKDFENRTAANLTLNEIMLLENRINNPEARAGRNLVFMIGDWWDSVHGNPPRRGEKEWNKASNEHISNKRKEIRALLQNDLQNGEFKKRFEDKYIGKDGKALLDTAQMESCSNDFENKCKEAKILSAKRGDDHMAWIGSKELMAAFALYDDEDIENGWLFSGQSGLCVFGAEGHEPMAELFKKWWQGSADDLKNLALRGLALNQKEIKDEIDRISTPSNSELQKAQTSEYSILEITLSNTQKLSSLYDAANDVYEQMEENGQSRMASSALAWYASLGTQLLRYPPNGPEGWMFQRITRLLSGSIARRIIALRLVEVARTRTEPYFRNQIESAAQKAYINARRSEFYRVRACAGLLFLEGMLFMLEASRFSDEERSERSLLFGQALLVTSAGMELAAALTDIVVRRFGERSVMHRGAQYSFGRFKLWGGGLGAAGGIVLAMQDWKDKTKAFGENRAILGLAYLVRCSASIVMAGGQFSLGVIAAKPMLERNVQRGAGFFTRSLLYLSTRLAPHAATISLCMLRIFWVITAATVIIWIFSDNAMQNWCEKSVFRRDKAKGEKPYKDALEEVAQLYAALEEIL